MDRFKRKLTEEEQKVEDQIKELRNKLPKKTRNQRVLPVALNEDEFTKLIRNTNQDHHKIAFLLGYGSGLRISEIINLEQRDINIQEKRILVRQGKGSKDRIVPLPKGFKEKHMKLIPIKCKQRSLQIAFKSAAKKAGLLENKPSLHFHNLRHSFCTHLVEQGMPIHHIRTLAGHSNISTTNIYLVANPKSALQSYEELF